MRGPKQLQYMSKGCVSGSVQAPSDGKVELYTDPALTALAQH